MDYNQLLSEGVVSSISEEILDESAPIWTISKKIIKKSKLDFDILSIMPIGGTQDYDVYELIGEEYSYILKISLDEDCQFLINEAIFHDENKDNISITNVVSYGDLIYGDKIIYSIYEKEHMEYLTPGQVASIPSEDFLNAIGVFSSSKTEKTFEDFLNYHLETYFLDNHNYLQFFLRDQDSKQVKQTFKSIKKSLMSNCVIEFLNQGSVSHGNLGFDSILFYNNFFKFNNCGWSFRGNKVIDICFLIINIMLNEELTIKTKKLIIEKFNLKEDHFNEEFDYVMSVAMHMKSMELFFKFLIEDLIFNNSREIISFNLFRNILYLHDLCLKNKILIKEISYIRDYAVESLYGEVDGGDEDAHFLDHLNEPHIKEIIRKHNLSTFAYDKKLDAPTSLNCEIKTNLNKTYLNLSWDNNIPECSKCIVVKNAYEPPTYYYVDSELNKFETELSHPSKQCLVGIKNICKESELDVSFDSDYCTTIIDTYGLK